MSSEEEFLKEKELKLTEVENVLAMLLGIVSEDDRHLRDRYLRLIGHLQQKSRSLRTELAKLREVGDDGREHLQDGIDVAWSKLRKAVESAICDFESEAR